MVRSFITVDQLWHGWETRFILNSTPEDRDYVSSIVLQVFLVNMKKHVKMFRKLNSVDAEFRSR